MYATIKVLFGRVRPPRRSIRFVYFVAKSSRAKFLKRLGIRERRGLCAKGPAKGRGCDTNLWSGRVAVAEANTCVECTLYDLSSPRIDL